MARIPASSILLEASAAIEQARALGLSVPSLTSRDLKYSLHTTYRDVLSDNGIRIEDVGALLGNRARWDAPLCRLFVLRFLDFFATRLAGDKVLGLTDAFFSQGAKSKALPWYRGSEFTPMYTPDAPTLYFGDPRTLTIKQRVMFPNVSKGPDEYMFKLINLRYDVASSGDVKLLPFPAFAARVAPGGALSATGLISNLPGYICRFSHCQLAGLIRKLVDSAFRMVVGEPVTAADVRVARLLADVVNLVCATNERFEIAGGPTATALRINSAELTAAGFIFFVVGSRDAIEAFARGETSPAHVMAHDAAKFDLSEVSVYANLPDTDTAVYGALFTASTTPVYIDDDLVTFVEGTHATDVEVLSESELVSALLGA